MEYLFVSKLVSLIGRRPSDSFVEHRGSKCHRETFIEEKVSKYGFFLVRNFLKSVQIEKNTDKKKTPYVDTFHAVFEP